MTNFKITLPDRPINKEEVIARNKGMFTQDYNKEGVLAKVFVFLNMNEPAPASELADKLTKYYGVEFDRIAVWRALKRLTSLNIIHEVSVSSVMSIRPEELIPIHKKIIDKYYIYIEGKPAVYAKKFVHTNYYFVANGEGLEYIKWCCRLLNFKCENLDESKKEIKKGNI